VGVMDFEGGADEIVHIVDLGTRHIRHGNGIDGHARAGFLDNEIVAVGLGHDLEIVFEPRAAAAQHADAQGIPGGGLLRHNLANTVGGTLAHAYVRIVRHDDCSPLWNLPEEFGCSRVNVNRRKPKETFAWPGLHHTPRTQSRAAAGFMRRPPAPRGRSISATATALSIRPRSAGSSTRHRFSSTTKAIITARG